MGAMCFKWLVCIMAFLALGGGSFAKVKHQLAVKPAWMFSRNFGNYTDASNSGSWPSAFNLATKAVITANATCGESGQEEFCRMSESGKTRCGICDNSDPSKRHSIAFAIDGTNKWWQSPALFYGKQYEYVTITIDLKQVYQIIYITIKSAISPRPGTWIVERSLDGRKYEAWQYFARNDRECSEKFGIIATKGKPVYSAEMEVICTPFYSKMMPLENGEVHIPIAEGRSGINDVNPEISSFTKARYIRLRFMALNGVHKTLPHGLSQDIRKDKKLFYSIRDIHIGGHCVCNGHATNCRHNVASGHPECECHHHTCGPNCERCCPMFNQELWGPGSLRDANQCIPCNCHGHASSCHYDAEIDKARLSMNSHGKYQGGGVCDNCTDFTTGINCELCIPGYFRPSSLLPSALEPCLPCGCNQIGSSSCIQYGEDAGKCICSEGYSGEKCDQCASQLALWPKCETCSCDPRGVFQSRTCGDRCVCKTNVEGKHCDRCKSGYFGLRSDLAEGCYQCYCSDVTNLCESAVLIPRKIQSLDTWLMTDLKISRIVKPNWNGKSLFSLGNYEFPGVKSLYWLAPEDYLGNKLEAYNSNFVFKVQWVVMRGDTSGEPTKGPDMIIVGDNGMKIGHGNNSYTSSKMTFQIKLTERNWYHMPEVDDIAGESSNFQPGKAVNRKEFLSVLMGIKSMLLRSTFHTDQIESLLEFVLMDIIEEEPGYGGVEKCSCPSGYGGLSCESCSFGYVRIYSNSTNNSESGLCAKCDCNGHSSTCDADTGECFCQHNTVGDKCERCGPGYYGNPLKATSADCKKCACPLENDENNFSPSCQLDLSKLELGYGNYVCTQCPRGYTGDHCEICDDGYYGDPLEIGNSCKVCDCNGGPCDRKTGKCLGCKGNTEGWKCENCKPDHYGEPLLSNCKACECDPIGSISKQCDNITGQCDCKPKFIGRTCDRCKPGYGNITALCKPCTCNLVGAKFHVCDTLTGTCECRPGVEGFYCDACQNLYYGFSSNGCERKLFQWSLIII